MVLIFVSCAELPAADVTENESETPTEAMVEGETEKESESEQETESEWTPIPLSKKISWMNELWPGWNERVEYAEPDELEYYQSWCLWWYNEDDGMSGSKEVGKVMYSTRRQQVYELIYMPESAPILNPYCGPVINALEKGEPVYVEEILCSRWRPEDGVYYRIGKGESLQGQSVFEGYALYLSDTPPEEGTQEEIPTWGAKAPVRWEEKEWMNDIWPDWKKWVNWSLFHDELEFYENGSKYFPDYYQGISFSLAVRWSYGELLRAYYPEWWDYESVDMWAYERQQKMEKLNSAAYIQTERIDRVMYATENQLVYHKIITASDQTLKEPYCGFVVGALEKGDAVRVVLVIENQKNPDDPVFYGIAYEPRLGTAPFMDSYIDPFIELLDGLDPELTAFGFASKLSTEKPE